MTQPNQPSSVADGPSSVEQQFNHISLLSETARKKKKSLEHTDYRVEGKRFGKFVKNAFVSRKSLLDEVQDSGISRI